MSSNTHFGIDFNIKPGQIYLDSATIGKMPISSIETITNFYSNGGGVPVRGMYNEISQANNILESNRRELASMFQIDPIQISFFSSREVVLTNTLYSLPDLKDRRIVSSILEEHSVIAPAIRVNNDVGTKIEYLNLDDEIDILDSINEKINSKEDILLLSSLTATNGVKRNWSEITKICQDNGATFILDMSYSVGHEEILLKDNMPDIVFSSGCIGALGPPGTAFQITTNEIYPDMDPLIVGGGSIITLEEEYYLLNSAGSKFETGLLNIANISSMTNSLKLLSEVGFTKIQQHEETLISHLHKGLKDIEGIEVNELENAEYGSIVSFGSELIEAHDFALVLEDLKNIQVRSGALCSHLFMYELKYSDIVRISTHLYNTKEEITILLETISSLLKQMQI
ncbi:MAG: aminotransferase class V-fold PLP-dependent enzyme [Candidatus Heimdallarchaeota archaeon]|nr:aminotransferase class V-fold PLP-dependent enzyme [Candidatus Heimdallarchaeota archaeon]